MTNLTEQYEVGGTPICKEGSYVYTENGIEKVHYCQVGCITERVTPKANILEPVPSYEKWEQLQNWADFTKDYHELREKLEIAEYKNTKLKEDYNRLGKLIQKMEDSDNAREKFQNGQIDKLKELLKECKEAIEKAQKNYGYDDFIVEILEPVTTKIDEVLK